MIFYILQGYWMVKRAVGTKACLLGKAVTCNYLRKDNFLEVNFNLELFPLVCGSEHISWFPLACLL